MITTRSMAVMQSDMVLEKLKALHLDWKAPRMRVAYSLGSVSAI